ncbi:MAG: lipid-A-disaccharide synthase [Aquificaceae bacterium]
MKVFVSLGERSASNYIYHIFKDVKGIDFYGVTDERLETLGFKSLAKLEDLSVVGIVEALPKIPYVYKLWKRIEELLPEMDVLLLCDAPAFNIPLLKRAKGKVKRIIYFISPQVWAWKENRAKIISHLADHLVVILPFEVDFYKKYKREGFKVHFVGHPLIDLAKPSMSEEEFKALVGYDRYLALLPGSRWSEIKRHVPYLRSFLECLRPSSPLVIPTFESFRGYIEEGFKGLPIKTITPKEVEKPSYNAMAYGDFTLLASGTAELEASLLMAPHIVFYRVNPLTYLLGRLLVRVKYIALTNLIFQREVVPELVQRSPQDLCKLARDYIQREEKRQAMKESFKGLRKLLGEEGSIQRLRELFFKLFYEG